MDPTYGPNNNPNLDVVLDVIDAEPMIPTETSPFNDELGSSNCEYFDAKSDTLIGDGDIGEEIIDNNTTAPPSIDGNEDALVVNEDTHCKDCKMPKELIQNLCQAALEGNWPDAEPVIDRLPSVVCETLSHGNETALHIAAAAKKTAFVEKLIQRMTSADLLFKNKLGYTALCYAAITGIVRIAEVMVLKNEDLPNVPARNNVLPISLAVTYKHKDMVQYLFSVTKFKLLEIKQQSGLLNATISVDYYDIGLKILEKNPRLAIMRDKNDDTALHVLARKPSAIGSRSELKIWEKCIKFCFKGLYNKALMKTLAHRLVESLWEAALKELPNYERNMSDPIHRSLSRLLHDAARVGNVEFLIVLFRIRPDLIWRIDKNEKSIFHVAVENRQDRVFNLIYVLGGLKDQIINHDIGDNYNMLHLAGKLAAPIHLRRVSGKALQMQHELLWFKEVEKIVAPFHLMEKCGKKEDSEKLTPRELFTKEHKKLLKEGEEWLKNTANSCMLVATLIATVVFAAAFTVPGGTDNNNNTGIPVFQGRDWFTVFVISDAAALVSSSTSILMFLSILTSRYAEDDFLHSLPSKLLFGLASLFISIVCMVVAFSATFFMLYHNGKIWVPITVAAMTILPVSSFCVLQFRLWADTFRTTYFSRFRFKPHKPKLYEGVSRKLEWWTWVFDLDPELVQGNLKEE